MKKIIIGLLALSSLTSFAQEMRELKIQNVTYPGRTMTLKCDVEACTDFQLSLELNGKVTNEYFFKKGTVVGTESNRRRYRSSKGYHPYDFSSKTWKNVKRTFREGYNDRAVGNTLLMAPSIALDTLALPVGILSKYVFEISHNDNKDHKSAARMILNNFYSDLDTVKIKHKYFNQIHQYVNRISYSTTGVQDPIEAQVYQDYLNGAFSNCQIKLITYDSYYRLFVNNVIVSDTPVSDKRLVNTLNELEADQVCIRN